MIPTSPKIGLALGSGSARGWAHIGVIRELEALGIPIHAIAGCSIGSLVGGAYALGKLDKLEEWARSLSLRHTALLLMDPHWGTGGILSGERMMRILRELDLDGRIEELAIPFAALATDMQTGEEVWLQKGSVLDAIRGSASLPGLVRPHHYGDKWLLDGGLVNPVPVALTKALGCDHVIAVNLNRDLLTPGLNPQTASSGAQLLEMTLAYVPRSLLNVCKWIGHHLPHLESDDEEPSSLTEALSNHAPNYRQVIWSMMTIMQDRITHYRMRIDQPDIELIPNLSHLSFLSFHSASEAIEEGRRAVRAQASNLLTLLEKIQKK